MEVLEVLESLVNDGVSQEAGEVVVGVVLDIHQDAATLGQVVRAGGSSPTAVPASLACERQQAHESGKRRLWHLECGGEWREAVMAASRRAAIPPAWQHEWIACLLSREGPHARS